jgi:hypothetical protein
VVGDAALVDEPPTSEVGRGAATADAKVKTTEAAESPYAPKTAPATDAGRETAGAEATAAATGLRGGPSPFEPASAPATGAGREAAATTKGMVHEASAGVQGGPSLLEPTVTSATDAGWEAAAAGLEATTTGGASSGTAQGAAVQWTTAEDEPPSIHGEV